MEFRNLTPFDALCYGALDPDDDEHTVIAMKVGYQLVRQPDGRWDAIVMDEEPAPLCMADEFWGEPGESSVKQESDLAPFKPRCDVLVSGQAGAPGGHPSAQWETRLRVSVPQAAATSAEPDMPQPLNPLMGLTNEQLSRWRRDRERAALQPVPAGPHERVLFDKRLMILGPHRLPYRRLLPGHGRTRPEPIAALPLRWEYAFGGRSHVANSADPTAEPWLNEVCFSNPLGTGWREARELRMARKARHRRERTLAGPQIVLPGAPLAKPVIVSHPKGEQTAARMAEIAARYGVSPVGYGPLGRAWAPRLAFAGTYDQAWLDERHPGLPDDIDFSYWNGAPQDQQTDYLPPSFRVQAWNLGLHDQTGGHIDVTLPGHRPFLLLRMASGVMLPMPMVTDTVMLDTDTMTLMLTHRSWIPAGTPPVRALEARFETDPTAPLIKRRQPAAEVEA